MVKPNKQYTFSYLGSAPVTWVVDAINTESDQIYLHQEGNGKTLQMSLEHFEALYRQHGVPAKLTQIAKERSKSNGRKSP